MAGANFERPCLGFTTFDFDVLRDAVKEAVDEIDHGGTRAKGFEHGYNKTSVQNIEGGAGVKRYYGNIVAVHSFFLDGVSEIDDGLFCAFSCSITVHG